MNIREQVMHMSHTELFRLIEREQLEIQYESVDDFEDAEEDDESSVIVFPFKHGGVHGYGNTLREAIADAVVSNDIQVMS